MILEIYIFTFFVYVFLSGWSIAEQNNTKTCEEFERCCKDTTRATTLEKFIVLMQIIIRKQNSRKKERFSITIERCLKRSFFTNQSDRFTYSTYSFSTMAFRTHLKCTWIYAWGGPKETCWKLLWLVTTSCFET